MKFLTMLISTVCFFSVVSTQLEASESSPSSENYPKPERSNRYFDVLHSLICLTIAIERKQKELKELEIKHHLPNSINEFLKNGKDRSQPVCLVVINNECVRAVAIHYIELFGFKFFFSNIEGLGTGFPFTFAEDKIVKADLRDKNGLLKHLDVNNLIKKAMNKYKEHCILLLSNFVQLDRNWTCEYFKHNKSSTPLLENYPNPATFKNEKSGHERTTLHFRPDLISKLMKITEKPSWDQRCSSFVANMYLTHNEANSDLEKENDFLAYCKNNGIGISYAIQSFLHGAEGGKYAVCG